MKDFEERHISSSLPAGWDIFFQKYLAEHTAVGKNTARKYVAVMRQAIRKDTLDSQRLAKFSKERNRFYIRAAIGKFLDCLIYNRLLTEKEAKDYLAGIPQVKEKSPADRELMTMEEMSKVLGKLEKEERFVARFLFYTGCRISEAMAVRLKDINFKTGFATIMEVKGMAKPRAVMLPPGFSKELKNYVGNLGVLSGEAIFYPFSKSGPNDKAKVFDGRFRKACMAAIGRSPGSHEFRRIFATTLYEKTRDIQFVQQVLGHTRMETTARYTRYAKSPVSMKQAMEIMDEALKIKNTAS